jgi:hypothetical protein
MDTFFTRHTFGVLLSTVIVIVAGLVCIAWRIKKVEDPGEILYWKGIWVFVFSLLVVVGFYWFILVGLGRMGAH